MPEIDLADARALLDRAEQHYREFNETAHGPGLSKLWNIQEGFDVVTAEWCYRATIDRGRLVSAKPILADAASNVVSALDHVVAACAKTNGGKRQGLYFPRGKTNAEFERSLKAIAIRIGATGARAIRRANSRYEAAHVRAAREIANSGKHWELLLSNGSMRAAVWNVPGEQRIFQIPEDAFASNSGYEFHRTRARMPNVGRTVVVGFRVAGLPDDLPASPDSIFPCAFRFVRGVIDAVHDAHVPGMTIRVPISEYPQRALISYGLKRSPVCDSDDGRDPMNVSS